MYVLLRMFGIDGLMDVCSLSGSTKLALNFINLNIIQLVNQIPINVKKMMHELPK